MRYINIITQITGILVAIFVGNIIAGKAGILLNWLRKNPFTLLVIFGLAALIACAYYITGEYVY